MKNRLERIAEQLGPEYIVTNIDFEDVIYRDFGGGYDVEISGLKHKPQATIYLWDNGLIVERRDKVKLEDIKGTVSELEEIATRRKEQKADIRTELESMAGGMLDAEEQQRINSIK